jgi:hypothetical protein
MVSIWRPIINLSTDGQPLAVLASDLFITSFPYDRLPTNDDATTNYSASIIAFFMKPSTPILLIIAYLITESFVLPKICRSLGVNGKSTFWKIIFALHNFSLALFSLVVFVNSWPIVLQHLYKTGLNATFCDQDGSLWSSGLGSWATIFYLSKYYEFIDSYVLIIKNKKPSFLQVYHHAGIVITMWGGVASQGSWILIVVLLNSGIHTLMYTYFLIKTIWPKMTIKQAKYLTTAQIVQFFTGITYTLPIHVLGSDCDSTASRMVCLFIELYAVGLIVLFIAFAKKKYKKKAT